MQVLTCTISVLRSVLKVHGKAENTGWLNRLLEDSSRNACISTERPKQTRELVFGAGHNWTFNACSLKTG